MQIENPKLVLKAAHTVWAANKYFVLACSQQHYLKIRHDLRPDVQQLASAYTTLKEISKEFGEIKTAQLPQLGNALYHIVGYFKGKLSHEERQRMDQYIRTNPEIAIKKLEKYTFELDVNYLKMSTFWQKHRANPFNSIPVELKYKGVIYAEHQLLWNGDSVTVNRETK